MLTKIFLVRHGETSWNTEKRIQGHIDIALNEAGLRQADATARALKALPLTAIYSSDLARAWQTAERIAGALNLVPNASPDLRERRYGVFEGLNYEEARASHPESYERFVRRDPEFAIPGGGESLRDIASRVTACLRALALAHVGETIVLVTHGGALDVANRFVRDKPLDHPRDFQIPNACICRLTVVGDAWQLASWGETHHLADGGLDEL